MLAATAPACWHAAITLFAICRYYDVFAYADYFAAMPGCLTRLATPCCHYLPRHMLLMAFRYYAIAYAGYEFSDAIDISPLRLLPPFLSLPHAMKLPLRCCYAAYMLTLPLCCQHTLFCQY